MNRLPKSVFPERLTFRHRDKARSGAAKDRSAVVVAYCGHEYCSAYRAAAVAASELGDTNEKHYALGVDDWQKSGAKVEKS